MSTEARAIKEILESYVEFIDIVLTENEFDVKLIAEHRKPKWKEVLKRITEDIKTQEKENAKD